MLNEQLKSAILKYDSGDYQEALTELLLCEYSEEEYVIHYYLGLCYIKLGDYHSGKENLELFLDLDDNLLRVFQCRMLIAYISIETESYRDALFHLDNLLDSGYESAKLYSLMGYTYYRRGVISKSITYYRRALAIDPENANALNALGYILSDFKDDLKEAESLCRRALSINVDNAAYLDSLGVVCMRNSKLDASNSFLNRAKTLAPMNREIEDHLSELNKLRAQHA